MKEKIIQKICLIGLVVLTSGCASAVRAETVMTSDAMTPGQVTEGFYGWYLEYAERDSDGNFRNPLIDRAYRDSEYMSETFVNEIDGVLEEMEMGGYDPFLCAQDIPDEVHIIDSYLEGDAIVMVMESSFEGHQFEVELSPENESYLISGIRCK